MHFLEESGDAAAALSILTPHGDNVRQEIGAAFRAWYERQPGYGEAPEISWIDQGGTSEDLRYVQSRFAKTARGVPSSIGVDLFFGGGTPPFRTLAKAGLLAPASMPREALAAVPARIGDIPVRSDSEGWYGVALSSFGILYNVPLLKSKALPVPRSWADLGEPGADGQVASVDPRGSGSAHVIYEIVLQKYGWEPGWQLLTRIAANSSHFTKGASAVLPLVSTGEAAYTIAIDQYAWSLIEKLGTDKVGFALPAGETVTTPDPAAMLKGAPHPLAAQRFLAFLVSGECQRIWALKAGAPGGPKTQSLNRMSVLPQVIASLNPGNSYVTGDPFAEAKAMRWSYSDSLTESRWTLVNDALGLWMVDAHEAARRAWVALNAKSPKSADSTRWAAAVKAEKYFRAPGSWDEMRGYAAKWKDDAFRNQTMAKWANALAR